MEEEEEKGGRKRRRRRRKRRRRNRNKKNKNKNKKRLRLREINTPQHVKSGEQRIRCVCVCFQMLTNVPMVHVSTAVDVSTVTTPIRASVRDVHLLSLASTANTVRVVLPDSVYK